MKKFNLGLACLLLALVTGCSAAKVSTEEGVIISEINEDAKTIVVHNYKDEDSVKTLVLSDEFNIGLFSVGKLMKVTYEHEEDKTDEGDLTTFTFCSSYSQCGLEE